MASLYLTSKRTDVLIQKTQTLETELAKAREEIKRLRKQVAQQAQQSDHTHRPDRG